MKKIFLIPLLLLLYSCGYTSIYKDKKNQDLQINILAMSGDSELNKLIKKEIDLYSNKDSNNKFDVDVFSSYQKTIIAKNSAGVATDFKIILMTNFSVKNNEEVINFDFNESTNMKNISDSFELNNYEKNIKKNYTASTREKLIIKLLNINDN
jgi:outer membrane lipopolysaccharide assembly protein LptE/RlpB